MFLGWFNGQTKSHLISSFWPKINTMKISSLIGWSRYIHTYNLSKTKTRTLQGDRDAMSNGKKKKCTIVVLIWETLFYYKKIKHFQIVYGVHSPTLHHSLNPSVHQCIFYFLLQPFFLPDLHQPKLTWVWPLEWQGLQATSYDIIHPYAMTKHRAQSCFHVFACNSNPP